MYKIIINDEIVSEVILPCYVFYDTIVRSFATCEYEKAEALLVYKISDEDVHESFYADLEEKDIRHEGFQIAKVVKVGE